MSFDELAEPKSYEPRATDYHFSNGQYIKASAFPRANTWIPQHAHESDHTTMVATGSFRVWCDGKLIGDFVAPAGIFIPAKMKHTFLTLEDNSTIYCIHRDEPVVHEEHQFALGKV